MIIKGFLLKDMMPVGLYNYKGLLMALILHLFDASVQTFMKSFFKIEKGNATI